ncbi:unnamed protein product, partial [Discosporangium mesarthrocarpum]
RYFLDNVASWILEVDRGSLIPFKGNYSQWLVQKQGRLDMEHMKQAQMARKMESELQWIQRGKATKAQSRDYDQMLKESQQVGQRLQQLQAG